MQKKSLLQFLGMLVLAFLTHTVSAQSVAPTGKSAQMSCTSTGNVDLTNNSTNNGNTNNSSTITTTTATSSTTIAQKAVPTPVAPKKQKLKEEEEEN